MSRVIPIKREQDTTVSVNGVVVSPEAIASEAQNHPMPKGKPGWVCRAVAHALVMRELLLQCARERGLTPEPEALMPGQWETDEEALIRQLLESELSPTPIDEAQLRALYDQSDRKSTRLNSSHVASSYAVFCLKKKKKRRQQAKSDKKSHDH